MNITLNHDGHIKDLSGLQINLIARLSEYFKLSTTVLLSETIHGHIVDIEKAKFFEHEKGEVARLNVADINLITDLMNDYGENGVRWVEVYKDKVSVGL